MRIDLFNTAASQISNEQSSQQVGVQKAAKQGQSDVEDRATLTSDSVSISSLVSTALNSPEVRQDKVNGLQQAIGSGQYELDPAKIAASIVDEQA
ncbi:MAG TPA: flagellar biosynthesis anti-sigma factor FlgM [Acidobacteriaceae bacterium]|jgi:negative regulator of flagellin synthesis FlgM|nr:flagellar biosynthesis anti-sigma factor FlgM [Acidobacteriaceae bacterium]